MIAAKIAIKGATVDFGIANEVQVPASRRFDESELSMAHICFVTSAEVGERQGLIANQTFLSSISRAAGRVERRWRTLGALVFWCPSQNCFIKKTKPVFVRRGFADRWAVQCPPMNGRITSGLVVTYIEIRTERSRQVWASGSGMNSYEGYRWALQRNLSIQTMEIDLVSTILSTQSS